MLCPLLDVCVPSVDVCRPSRRPRALLATVADLALLRLGARAPAERAGLAHSGLVDGLRRACSAGALGPRTGVGFPASVVLHANGSVFSRVVRALLNLSLSLCL